MTSPAITTVIKMMETLPESTQNQVVEHLQEYLEDILDEMQWDETFKKTQAQLSAAAHRVRQEIAEGKGEPLDLDKL